MDHRKGRSLFRKEVEKIKFLVWSKVWPAQVLHLYREGGGGLHEGVGVLQPLVWGVWGGGGSLHGGDREKRLHLRCKTL